LKCRGSGENRGFSGVDPAPTVISQVTWKRPVIVTTQKTSVPSASSAFQGFGFALTEKV
jgi:hypothetical protein